MSQGDHQFLWLLLSDLLLVNVRALKPKRGKIRKERRQITSKLLELTIPRRRGGKSPTSNLNWYPISARIWRRDADEEPRISCIVNQSKRTSTIQVRETRFGVIGGSGKITGCFAYSESRRGGHCFSPLSPRPRKEKIFRLSWLYYHQQLVRLCGLYDSF